MLEKEYIPKEIFLYDELHENRERLKAKRSSHFRKVPFSTYALFHVNRYASRVRNGKLAPSKDTDGSMVDQKIYLENPSVQLGEASHILLWGRFDS
jgi:hypothetical protein